MVAATGIGSGLDIEGLVTQLVQAERAPTEERLLQEEARTTAEISAFGTFQGALGGLQDAVRSLNNLSTFNQRQANSSDSSAVGVTANASAAVGNFRVGVTNLAEAQSLASGLFTSEDDVVGEGTLTFRFGTVATSPPAETPGGAPQTFDSFALNADRATATVTIDSSNNTLAGIRDAINEADIGVSALIVNDEAGVRLLLNSSETGAANGIEIQASETTNPGTGLSRFDFNEASANLTQTVAGQDAAFTINGLDVTSATNSVSDVIDGVTLNLQATTEAPVNVSISENTGAVRGAIDGFVAAFNAFITTADRVSAFDAETQQASPLTGDFTVRSVVSQLRSAISTPADGFDGPFSTLAELGITTQADGTLEIDEARLDRAIAEDFDSLAGVFAQTAQAADSEISFSGATPATQVGRFAVSISQLATRGTATISDVDRFDFSSQSQSFSVTVDGVESGPISLAQQDFGTGEALAAALQSSINGDDALRDAGRSVSVSFSNGRLEVRSVQFGSVSTVELAGIDASTFSNANASQIVETAGLDVAGTIDGVAATGDGQLLRATSGRAEGLRLTVTGGALGDRGTVDVSEGLGVALDGLLDTYLGTGGILASRTDGLEAIIDRIEVDRERLETRLDAIEARFRRQFNALDILLADLQSTSEFLTTQLASIPIPGVDRDN